MEVKRVVAAVMCTVVMSSITHSDRNTAIAYYDENVYSSEYADSNYDSEYSESYFEEFNYCSDSIGKTAHTVIYGDCISIIADLYGVSQQALLAENGLQASSLIQPGDVLRIPVENSDSYVEYSSEEYTESTVSSVYTVVYGDCISSIADSYGVSLQALLAENGLQTSSLIQPGDVLKIPVADSYATNSYGVETVEKQVYPSGYYGGTTYSNEWESLANIEHACNDMNGMIVPAYSWFSWSSYMGPCMDGYEEASTMTGSARGGGICMVASCLRIALENTGADFQIIGYNHTDIDGNPVDMPYAPIGHQAAIDYGSLDFKWYNPFDVPYKINSSFDWSTKTCYISVEPVV